MTDANFQSELAILQERIASLPPEARERLASLAAETIKRHIAIRAAKQQSLDAIDDWRIALKYAIFDGECRQRESAGNA